MGISRSAATVVAYAMKEYGWDLKKALDYVKERRTVTKPNPSFMRQLEEYQGILMARYPHARTMMPTLNALNNEEEDNIHTQLNMHLTYYLQFV